MHVLHLILIKLRHPAGPFHTTTLHTEDYIAYTKIWPNADTSIDLLDHLKYTNHRSIKHKFINTSSPLFLKMDIEDGHCWNCEMKLQVPVTCDGCHVAEYCSQNCKKKDNGRHFTQECFTISPRVCSNCQQEGENLLAVRIF